MVYTYISNQLSPPSWCRYIILTHFPFLKKISIHFLLLMNMFFLRKRKLIYLCIRSNYIFYLKCLKNGKCILFPKFAFVLVLGLHTYFVMDTLQLLLLRDYWQNCYGHCTLRMSEQNLKLELLPPFWNLQRYEMTLKIKKLSFKFTDQNLLLAQFLSFHGKWNNCLDLVIDKT